MARSAGKTTAIAEQVNWCAMFDILPVCILVRNEVMRRDMYLKLKDFGITQEELNSIVVITTSSVSHSHPHSTSINGVLDKIRGTKFYRIYIDDVTEVPQELVDALRLQLQYDNIMYVYGTPSTLDVDIFPLGRFEFAVT